MPIDRTPAHHWWTMREYHYDRWEALDRLWLLYVRPKYRHKPALSSSTFTIVIPTLWEELQHHDKCERQATNKWRRMQAKARRRREAA